VKSFSAGLAHRTQAFTVGRSPRPARRPVGGRRLHQRRSTHQPTSTRYSGDPGFGGGARAADATRRGGAEEAHRRPDGQGDGGVHPRLRSRAGHLLPTTTALPARAYQERRAVRRVRRRRPHLAAALVLPLLAAAAGPAAARDPPPVRSLLELRQDRVVIQQWDNSCGAAALTTVLRPAGQTHARHIKSIPSLFHPFRLRQGPSTNCGAGAPASDPRAPGYVDWHFGQWR
jgi:hypothetical protein